MKRLAIGMTANVDAGKTTLSEALLYRAGEIHTLGRVDKGNAFLDNSEMERRRGITIFSHQATFSYEGAAYTLLDTPGHADFSAETERAMQVLDYAVLVISAPDGVDSHTKTLMSLLRRHHIPVFLFVNKMDLPHASKEDILAEIRSAFGGGCVDFTNEGTPAFFESVALCRESWAETYLETGRIHLEQLQRGIAAESLTPIFFGAALKLEGVDAFLSGLHRYTMQPPYSDIFGALVFKITADEKNTRLTHMKITGGTLRVRDTISGTDKDGDPWTEKVSQIRVYDGARFENVQEVDAGAVCSVVGLSATYAGQGLGLQPDGDGAVFEPALTYEMTLPPGATPAQVWKTLAPLREEEPLLHMRYLEERGKIQVAVSGELGLEVLEKILRDRFDLPVTFDAGRVTYRETIAAPVEGVGHFEPLRHYAEVHVLLEPLPRGSGLQFRSACPEDDLARNWQRLILSHMADKTHRGVLTGSPITDMRLTLVAGRAHPKHTEGGDFRQATYRAIRNGLRRAEGVLLEPWVRVHLEVPKACVGRAMTDMQQAGGEAHPVMVKGDRSVLEGRAPLSKIRDYPIILAAYTKGAGRITTDPDGFDACTNPEEILAAIGYDADADIANTADSVFCAGGAGFVVPWYEVESHMHLPFQKQEARNKTQESIAVQRSLPYGGTLEEDAELMQIFERTYGKIRRRERDVLHTPHETLQEEAQIPPAPRLEYLLVDGYNIIYAWEPLQKIAAENLDAARVQLERILINYNGYRRQNLILVFDAYRVSGHHEEVEQKDNITIVYTKEAETADAYIEKTARRLEKGARVRVATSDAMEQLIILGHGALRVSAAELEGEVEDAAAQIRAQLERLKRKSGKNRLTFPDPNS